MSDRYEGWVGGESGCRCRTVGAYCPVHGEYHPVIVDVEIAQVIYDNTRPHRVAERVVRKQLSR